MRPWLFTAIFLVVGLGLLGGSVYSVLSTREFLSSAVPAEGVVIDLEARWDSDDGGYTYYPRVRFATESGQLREFTGDVGSSPASFDIGEGVHVLFDPADPADAHIDSFMQLWFVSLILGVLGIVFTAVGSGGLLTAAGQTKRDLGASRPSIPARQAGGAEPQGTPQTSRAKPSASVVERTSRD
jgi:Protein of unknown function (DUF3592)